MENMPHHVWIAGNGTVELILQKLGEGMAVPELLEAYPHLTRHDVLAALSFAADYLRNEDIQFGQPEAA
jgi:uncharacterized protein (DUF433 family)